jgi:hypothetical protein
LQQAWLCPHLHPGRTPYGGRNPDMAATTANQALERILQLLIIRVRMLAFAAITHPFRQ